MDPSTREKATRRPPARPILRSWLARATLILCGWLVATLAALPSRAAEPAASPSPHCGFDAERRLFVSEAMPALELPIPEGCDYLGRLEFPIKDQAWSDRHLFARADGRRIERLVVLQFEGFLPEIEGRYGFSIPRSDQVAGSHYRFSPERIELGGYGYVHDTWAFDHRANAAENPGLESERTLRHLESEGWELADELIMSRFVREVGDARRKGADPLLPGAAGGGGPLAGRVPRRRVPFGDLRPALRAGHPGVARALRAARGRRAAPRRAPRLGGVASCSEDGRGGEPRLYEATRLRYRDIACQTSARASRSLCPAPGGASASRRPWATGMIRSALPWTTRVGKVSSPARESES